MRNWIVQVPMSTNYSSQTIVLDSDDETSITMDVFEVKNTVECVPDSVENHHKDDGIEVSSKSKDSDTLSDEWVQLPCIDFDRKKGKPSKKQRRVNSAGGIAKKSRKPKRQQSLKPQLRHSRAQSKCDEAVGKSDLDLDLFDKRLRNQDLHIGENILIRSDDVAEEFYIGKIISVPDKKSIVVQWYEAVHSLSPVNKKLVAKACTGSKIENDDYVLMTQMQTISFETVMGPCRIVKERNEKSELDIYRVIAKQKRGSTGFHKI